MDAVLARATSSGGRTTSSAVIGGRCLLDSLRGRYPGLAVAGIVCPPFRPLTADEDRGLVARINGTAPDIIWVGLGTPKQEHWMSEHRAVLNAAVLVGVGAAFDLRVRPPGAGATLDAAQRPRVALPPRLDRPAVAALPPEHPSVRRSPGQTSATALAGIGV